MRILASQVKVCEEQTPLKLQNTIAGEVMKAEERGNYLRDVQFSTASNGQIHYSAMLIFGAKDLEQ